MPQYFYVADPGQPGNEFTSLPVGTAPNLEALEAEINADAAIGETVVGSSMHLTQYCVEFAVDLGVPQKTALDAVIAAHTGAALLDTPQRQNSIAEQTSATPGEEVACTLSLTAVRGGAWQVTFYCEIAVQAVVANSGIFAKLYIDGTERAMSSSRDDQYQCFSGSALLAYNDGDTPQLELRYQRVGAANTAKIRRCQVALVREENE